MIGLFRLVVWCHIIGRNDEALETKLKHIAECNPSYGYPMLYYVLKVHDNTIILELLSGIPKRMSTNAH